MMKQYSTTIAWFPTGITLKVLYLNTLQPSIPFVLLEYVDGNISKFAEDTETYLDIFRVETDQATLIRQEKIAVASLSFEPNSDLEWKYRYVAGINLPDKSPAIKDIAKVFFTDANDDGYGDILVWTQRYRLRLIEEPGREDFVLEKERITGYVF